MRKNRKIEEEMDKRSEIVDRYYAIGEKLFAEPTCTEVRLTLELQTLCVAQRITHSDNGLGIWAEADGDDTGVIQFLPVIDRDDAFRLAGLLMAWGDSERIHKATAQPQAKQESDDGRRRNSINDGLRYEKRC